MRDFGNIFGTRVIYLGTFPDDKSREAIKSFYNELFEALVNIDPKFQSSGRNRHLVRGVISVNVGETLKFGMDLYDPTRNVRGEVGYFNAVPYKPSYSDLDEALYCALRPMRPELSERRYGAIEIIDKRKTHGRDVNYFINKGERALEVLLIIGKNPDADKDIERVIEEIDWNPEPTP